MNLWKPERLSCLAVLGLVVILLLGSIKTVTRKNLPIHLESSDSILTLALDGAFADTTLDGALKTCQNLLHHF